MPISRTEASWIGPKMCLDPNFTPPKRPQFIPELITLPYGDGWMFEGAKETQVIRGRSARTMLPRILRELDGTRTLAQLSARLEGINPAHIRDVVNFLYSRGLLEEGPAALADDECYDVDAFLGRFTDVTRANSNRAEALARLSRTHLALAGSEDGMAAFRPLLSHSGFGSVRSLGADGGMEDATFLLAVAVRESDDLGDILRLAWERRIPALHVRLSERIAQIGPVLSPGLSACYDCGRRIYDIPPGTASPEDTRFWAGLAALQLFQVVSRVASPALVNTFQHCETSAHGLVYEHRYVARFPGCPACGPAGPELDLDSPAFQSWVLCSSLDFPSRELYDPSAYQGHFKPANIKLTSELGDPFYGAPAVNLPAPGTLEVPLPWERLPDAGQRKVLDLESLSTLLFYSAGYERLGEAGLHRVDPTGGGLGSPDLFLYAGTVAGLPEGCYHYHAPTHTLEKLPYVSREEIGEALQIRDALPGLAIFGAAMIGRVHLKYDNFAYRIVHLDAGIVISYLRDVAAALGLPVQEYRDIADGPLARAIRLATKRTQNMVTFALGFDSPASDADRVRTEYSPRIFNQVIRAASVPGGAVPAAEPLVAAAEPDRLPIEKPLLLGNLILSRRSVRYYSDARIPRPVLDDILEKMHAVNESRGVSGDVAVWLAIRIDDPETCAGVYRWDAAAGGLVLLRRGFSQSDMASCVLQANLADAPAMAYVTGHLGRALEQRGARGYREMLMSAGGAVGRGMLCTVGHGLASCAFGGFFDAGMRALPNIDGYAHAALLGFTLGYPQEKWKWRALLRAERRSLK